MNKDTVAVYARKYDGRVHRKWEAELVQKHDELVVLKGFFEKDVTHLDLGAISKGTISYEYYWLDRWYNIFRFHEPNGEFRNHYCNINLPPSFRNNELNYVDLDLDILVDAEWNIRVLDQKEFYQNASKYEYSDDIMSTAIDQIDALTKMIESREFPFDWKP